MAGESYTYCLEIDSNDYVSVSCLSDGRVYKIRDLMRKEMNVLTEKYNVSPDGFVGLEPMAKPRYRSLHGVTEASTNRELFLGGFRGIDLSFEACGEEGSPCLEVIVPKDALNIRLLKDGKDVTSSWQEFKDEELMGAVFITYYEQYGQNCSFFRLTVEDMLGGTSHGKRFLNRLLKPSVPYTGTAATTASAPQGKQGSSMSDGVIKKSRSRKVGANKPAAASPSKPAKPGPRAKTPDSNTSDTKRLRGESTAVDALVKMTTAGVQHAANGSVGNTQNFMVSAPHQEGMGAEVAAEAPREEAAEVLGTGAGAAAAPAGPSSSSVVNAFSAMQLIMPLLEKKKVSKDVRWAMGQDLAKMPAEALSAFIKLASESESEDASWNVLRFYFPDCSL